MRVPFHRTRTAKSSWRHCSTTLTSTPTRPTTNWPLSSTARKPFSMPMTLKKIASLKAAAGNFWPTSAWWDTWLFTIGQREQLDWWNSSNNIFVTLNPGMRTDSYTSLKFNMSLAQDYAFEISPMKVTTIDFYLLRWQHPLWNWSSVRPFFPSKKILLFCQSHLTNLILSVSFWLWNKPKIHA